MPLRKYSSRSQQTTITTAVTSGATVIPVASATTLLGGISTSSISTSAIFTVVIDPDTALEEIIDIVGINNNNLTVVRAIDDSIAQDHSAGAVVRHMVIGRDLRDANLHANATGGTHGVSGDFVGTEGAQTINGVKTFTNATGTFVTPTIADLTNAQHDHQSAADGGVLAVAAISGLQTTLDNTAPLTHTHGLDARNIQDHGTVVTQRNNLNFTGNLTVTDDSVNNRTNVSVTVPDQSTPVKILSLMGAI